MAINKPLPDLARSYLDWLHDRVTTVKRGEATVLSTPFLDPFHDGIQIHAEMQGGEVVLHDNGDTLDNLLSLGVRIEDTARRRGLIQRATAGCGVRFTNGRLETSATPGNVPQRAHFLLTAILRLNDLWMSAVPHRWTDFLEMVQEFFDEQGVLYTANVNLAGRTVEHSIDFVIPLPKRRERLIKIVGDPNPQTAKVISFTWFDLQESRPNADRMVLINDVQVKDPFARLEGMVAEPQADEYRRVSDETVAILRGYSTEVFRWSERENPKFRQLWEPGTN
jgi:hypothetical protein